MTASNWYVVYTRPRCELKVANFLSRKHIKNYCPLQMVDNQMTDKKILFQPLFASYIFVCIYEYEITGILQTPGIINFLYWLNKPATVNENEVESLIQLLKEYRQVKLEKCLIHQNCNSKNDGCQCLEMEAVEKNDEVRLVLPSMGYCIIAKDPGETFTKRINF